MTTSPTVAVVGGGIAGLSLSVELARRGGNVTCYEAGSRPGIGCSLASVGLVYPTDDVSLPLEFRIALADSYANFPAYLGQLATRADKTVRWKQLSLLHAGHVPSASLRSLVDLAPNCTIQKHDNRQLRLLEPALRATAGGSLIEPVYWIHTGSLLHCLHRALTGYGGRLLLNTPVRPRMIGNRVTGVIGEKNHEIHHANIVIICAGYWSSAYFPEREQLARRGQVLIVNGLQLRHAVYAGELDVVPISNSAAMVGATQEDGASVRQSTARGTLNLLHWLFEWLEVPANARIHQTRVGIRSRTLDGRPVAEPHPSISNLWGFFGLWRNGVGLGPILAKRVADQIYGS